MITNSIVNEAIEYILLNIWDEVTLEKVAKHCQLSVTHFSRLFKEQTGESVYAFIKRIKMEQSALKLKMELQRDITEIGLDYGYSASNYSSAFSQYHKRSPSQFRHQFVKTDATTQKIIDTINSKIKIEIHGDYQVIYQIAIGNYKEMQEAWCQFVQDNKEDITPETIFFERTFDDPTITHSDKCIYDICVTTKHPEKYKNRCILTGGKFAVYPFKGYMQEILPLHQQLIGIWFPSTQYEIDNRYTYDRYYLVRNDGYMEFDICIPIR